MKSLFRYSWLIAWIFLLSACQVTETSQPALSSSATEAPLLTETPLAPTATPNPTNTVAAPSATPLIATETPTPEPTQPSVTQSASGIIIDHQAVALFEQIPPEYLQAASELLWLHRHASVGANIRMGLDCLANEFPERPYAPNISQIGRRPPWCDQNLSNAEIIFDEKYNSSNWIFEAHAEPNPNPGWNNKARNFIERIQNLEPAEAYQFVSYNFGYVEDPTLVAHFFTNTNPNDAFPSVVDLEALQAAHPQTRFIWWTAALARYTPPHILEFNQQLREYAVANNLILLDIADIEAHDPAGIPCTGVDASGNPTQITAICDDYADEPLAGHLNARGSLRMAKALWVMMAILAGWDGQPAE